MYQDMHYVASVDDEKAFRSQLENLGLHILPERPGGPVDLADTKIEQDRLRLLSLRPEKEVTVSNTLPYPHYSPAAQPLIEWEVPQIKGKLIITGHLRHHPYMMKEGPEFVEIGKAFNKIKKWFKANWRPINQFDFVGPGAARLLDEGYTWSSFDPATTRFAIVGADGRTKDITHDQWLKSKDDR